MKKETITYILIFILFLTALFIRAESIGVGLDHPGNLKAGNAFYHTILPTYLAEGVDVFTFPPNLAEGHDNIINTVSQHQALLIAPFIKFTGIQDWNLSVLIVAAISALSVPFMFILAKKIFKSTPVAILSAAFIAVPLYLKDWLYYTYIGIWLQSSAMTFILASFLLTYLVYEKLETWKLFALGIVSTALFLLFPIALLITLPLLIAVLIKILKTKKQRIKNTISYIITPLIGIIIAMPVYYLGYFTSKSYTSTVTSLKEQLATHPFVTDFTGFPIILTILFALGVLQLLLNYKKYKEIITFLIFYFALIFLAPHITPTGITVYIIRMWSTLPYIVFPIAAYGTHFLIIKNISKMTKIKEVFFIAIVIIILLIFGLSQYTDLKTSLSGEHVSLAKYQALKWIQENTEKDATVFMLEGSYQTEAAYTKRLTYQITIEDLSNKITELGQNNTLSLNFNSGWFHVASWARYIYRTGYLSHDTHKPLPIPQNILDFDYVYMEDLNEVIQQYNAIMIDSLTKEYNYEIVYDKAGYKILKKNE